MAPEHLGCIGTELLAVYLANVQRCAERGCVQCRAAAELYRRELVRRARLN